MGVVREAGSIRCEVSAYMRSMVIGRAKKALEWRFRFANVGSHQFLPEETLEVPLRCKHDTFDTCSTRRP
jgi:hypothetical protein